MLLTSHDLLQEPKGHHHQHRGQDQVNNLGDVALAENFLDVKIVE